MRHSFLTAVPVAALLLVVALARASSSGGPGVGANGSPVHGNSSLDEARGLPGVDLYFAGERVAGLPLTAVERRADTATYVSFLYGECEAGDHFGCALPLEIQTWPACRRSLSLYDAGDPFAPRPAGARIRGVPASTLDDGRQLELRTGDSTVVIFGETRALVNRAAAELRGVINGVRPGDPLTPPHRTAGSCE